MKLPRRQFLHLAAGAAGLPAMSRIARAQAYPSRPVRIIVGFAAGGSNDILARLIGSWLSERLGQPFIVETRPGAGGNIATEVVVNAAPDGHTLLLATVANTIGATVYDNLKFNFIRDIRPVASLIRVPNVLEVNPSFPVQTVPELIAYAKANPNRISMAVAANGTSQHISAELFKMMTGVEMVHVFYRGSAPALIDLIGGQTQVMFDNLASSIEHIRAGKVRALAVTTAMRSEILPDIPPLGDFLPGYEVSSWSGIGAPKNTPNEIVEKLNREINFALANARIRGRIADMASSVFASSPTDFAKLISEETEKWAKVVKFANIKPFPSPGSCWHYKTPL